MKLDKVLEWWENQGDNKSYEITKTAKVEAGTWGFCEVCWKHNGIAGKDRIYPRGKGYELIEMMG